MIWKRVKNIFVLENRHIFVDIARLRNFSNEGFPIDDRSFIYALNCALDNSGAVLRLFENTEVNTTGIFAVWLCLMGNW